jgi:hypothetical protein
MPTGLTFLPIGNSGLVMRTRSDESLRSLANIDLRSSPATLFAIYVLYMKVFTDVRRVRSTVYTVHLVRLLAELS